MKITYELEQQEAQMVIDALAELPLKASFNLFMKLNGQLRTQMEPAAKVPEKVQKAQTGQEAKKE
jgi:hypothetical protein